LPSFAASLSLQKSLRNILRTFSWFQFSFRNQTILDANLSTTETAVWNPPDGVAEHLGMPFFSLDERIRRWRPKLAGQREENTSPLTIEDGHQQGRCHRLTHANGKIFWAYLWTSSAQDSRAEKLGAARTLAHGVPEADHRRQPAA
jgi:hypothetical protein